MMASISTSPDRPTRAPTWTTDENDEDVRRMVITPGMIDRKAIVHRDALGRSYSQLPDYHGLCYAITYSNIYGMCKARPWDRKTGEQCFFGDRCFTIYKWFERLEAATGVSRDFGLYECELKNGQPIMVMVIACSDRAETVPRPAARIEAFKRFLRIAREPMLRRFNQPKVRSLFTILDGCSMPLSRCTAAKSLVRYVPIAGAEKVSVVACYSLLVSCPFLVVHTTLLRISMYCCHTRLVCSST